MARVLESNGIPGAVAGLVTGGKEAGAAIAESRDVELGISSQQIKWWSDLMNLCLVSFTGSEHVGRIVGKTVMSRFGKTILELGGNNGTYPSLHIATNHCSHHTFYQASIVMPDADLSMAVPSVFFGAVGTAGQRCTSTRRLYLHRDIAPEFLERLRKLYDTVKPADPLVDSTLLGPLHSSAAVKIYNDTIDHLRSIDAEILTGGSRYNDTPLDAGNFVQPTIAIPKSADPSGQIWSTETFAPILNAAIFENLEQAIEWNNAVPQVGTLVTPNRSTGMGLTMTRRVYLAAYGPETSGIWGNGSGQADQIPV